jgi:hypothetical protein
MQLESTHSEIERQPGRRHLGESLAYVLKHVNKKNDFCIARHKIQSYDASITASNWII